MEETRLCLVGGGGLGSEGDYARGDYLRGGGEYPWNFKECYAIFQYVTDYPLIFGLSFCCHYFPSHGPKRPNGNVTWPGTAMRPT